MKRGMDIDRSSVLVPFLVLLQHTCIFRRLKGERNKKNTSKKSYKTKDKQEYNQFSKFNKPCHQQDVQLSLSHKKTTQQSRCSRPVEKDTRETSSYTIIAAGKRNGGETRVESNKIKSS